MDFFKLTVVRHAQSEYNTAQMTAKKSEVEVKTNEDVVVKFSRSLIDCGISKEGEQQCASAREFFLTRKIDVVFVSPLRRALQTAKLIFGDHPSNPKFLVEPCIKEILSSTCDLAESFYKVSQEFPEFDWSEMKKYEYPELWVLYEYGDITHVPKLISMIKENNPTMKEPLHPEANEIIARYMQERYPLELETQFDINARAGRAKVVLKKRIMEFGEMSGDAVLVAHSRILEAMTATEFGENGKPLNGTWLRNGEAKDVLI